ncbi:hypothetical protein BOX15_Mlig004561g1 [Macrostomum lignano]|uniref:Lipocalin/cytosolic fatty-acid binding domain-containing protein n=1 Tax=Macrostomum lignano TaxID=282301 RepID=A0A267FM60_9PLAT|nr:hypothetical protein BOX15_Mlig004561g1 [Macrostomum lignano]
MEKFLGKWKSTKVENFDNFMKAMDVGFILRKAAAMATVYLDFQKADDGTWIIDWQLAFKKGQIRFQLGQEIDAVLPDDRSVRLVPDFDPATGWYSELQKGKPHDVKVERWITEDGEMQELVKIINKDVQYTRVYERY